MADPILCEVAGFNEAKNSVLLHVKQSAKRTILFFPVSVVYFFISSKGDIQNLKLEMFGEWEEYCLENTLQILKRKFPCDNILIVRPSRIKGYFSCFDNFMEPGHAILHMSCLMDSVSREVVRHGKFRSVV